MKKKIFIYLIEKKKHLDPFHYLVINCKGMRGREKEEEKN